MDRLKRAVLRPLAEALYLETHGEPESHSEWADSFNVIAQLIKILDTGLDAKALAAVERKRVLQAGAAFSVGGREVVILQAGTYEMTASTGLGEAVAATDRLKLVIDDLKTSEFSKPLDYFDRKSKKRRRWGRPK